MVVPWGSGGGGGVYTYYKVSTFSLEKQGFPPSLLWRNPLRTDLIFANRLTS